MAEDLRPYPRVVTVITGKSRTEQHHKAACDVNNIIKKYKNTGVLEQRLDSGIYGDFVNVQDYQECLKKVSDAKGDFLALPSEIRKRFHNDPGELIEFITNEENREEAYKLGILVKKQEPAPVLPESAPVSA